MDVDLAAARSTALASLLTDLREDYLARNTRGTRLTALPRT